MGIVHILTCSVSISSCHTVIYPPAQTPLSRPASLMIVGRQIQIQPCQSVQYTKSQAPHVATKKPTSQFTMVKSRFFKKITMIDYHFTASSKAMLFHMKPESVWVLFMPLPPSYWPTSPFYHICETNISPVAYSRRPFPYSVQISQGVEAVMVASVVQTDYKLKSVLKSLSAGA